MPRVDLVVETPLSRSPRVKQLEAMFDVPPQKKARMAWSGDLALDARSWQVGLIVGPSGCGKSSLLRYLFGDPPELTWSAPSVIDDFGQHSIETIANVCQAVGFNTIPAWMRPYHVLSNGERFRVELARRLLEAPNPVVIDEFTSVVDRQIAQIGAHAVQKHVRKTPGQRFVAASCHYDIVEWLQPDWVLEPATMSLTWRDLQRRPAVACSVSRVPYSAWRLFAPFHYLTADLHRAARCFGLFVGDRLASFAGMLHRPHAKVDNIMGCSRLVTLPDFQGLGLAMALIDVLGAAYGGMGKRLHTYPAHPALIRTFDRSPKWRLEKRPGRFSPSTGKTSTKPGAQGGRPCAVFEYVGERMARPDAEVLLASG